MPMIINHIFRRKFVVCGKGFTLVELLIVIAIIVTLAACHPIIFQLH